MPPLLIDARDRDLGGGFVVKRTLPTVKCRKVGPWVFADHFGPHSAIASTKGDVRQHPHIGLSTVTYLFDGSIEHRDSTGGHAIVRPGEIHWMRAGHGIVHSERAPRDTIGQEVQSHGLQLWCAHPDGEEDQEPHFGSWTDLPELDLDGVRVELLCGSGWGHESPVEVTSPLIYALAHIKAGQRLALPEHQELCAYVVSGAISALNTSVKAHQMLVFDAERGDIQAQQDSVVAILGGDAIGERRIWWNMVHSNPETLKVQAERWRNGGFPSVPDDIADHMPAPTGPH
ncbi:MAG: redox-sensitive bicupin YhaK (pirin superfamily) [Cognaticolwellia sp.]|jgi:redox-sensitive bicupin YhaK (pirin superfamily)